MTKMLTARWILTPMSPPTMLSVRMPGSRQAGAVPQAHGRRQRLSLGEPLVPPQQLQTEELQLLHCDPFQYDSLRSQPFDAAVPQGGCGHAPGCSREGQEAETVEGPTAVGGMGRHPKPPLHQQPAAILILRVEDTMVDHPLAAAVVVCAEWKAAVGALTAADPAVAISAAVPCRGCGRAGHGGVCECDDGLGRLTEEVAEAVLAGHGVTLAALVPPVVAAMKREGTAVSSALEQAGVAAPGSVAPRARGGQHVIAEIGGHAQQGMNLDSNLPAVATVMRRLRQSQLEGAARSVSTRIQCQRPLHRAHWLPSNQG